MSEIRKREIILVIKVMNGGGAERVICLLGKHFHELGRNVTLLITHQSLKDADLRRLDKAINVISLEDEVTDEGFALRWGRLLLRIKGKLLTWMKPDSDAALVNRYAVRNYAKFRWLRNYFKQHGKSAIVAFLYDAIFLSLLSRTGGNRLIISERGDPGQSLESKTDMAFFRSMFPKADAIVFQSPDVQKWYRENIGINGRVIFNPIKSGLPEPYQGKRNLKIVNFCRISPQKNLLLLIEAFEELSREYPDYELWIYGNADDNAADYVKSFHDRVNISQCKDKIHVVPAREDVHTAIIDSAMYVSSSDHEGMSNSMLEAMAIGLPVACTDCPAGGARTVIRDHENGLLVPIKDKHRLYLAMKELIENPELANRMSLNASKIRQCQAVENIMQEWQELM